MINHLPVPRMMGFATSEEVVEARAGRRPNTIFLSVGDECNLNCTYCYTVPKRLRPERPVLSAVEQAKLLQDAASIGVSYLVIPGPGEPLLYAGLKNLISTAMHHGMYTTIITNGTCIDKNTALYFKDLPVSFMVKLNSLDMRVQDHLTGCTGMAEKIYRTLDILAEAGFTGFPVTRLAIDALICQETIDELPEIVRFALERQIHPVVERLLPLGRGLENRATLEVEEAEADRVLEEVQRIMGEREGNAFSGCVCDLHDYTIFVDVDGMVTKCVGGQREILIGDCRTVSIREIWASQLEILAKDKVKQQTEPSCRLATKCPGRSYCEAKIGIIS